MSKWTFTGQNPIVNYSVGFELSALIGPSLIKELSTFGEKFSDDLPRKVEQTAFVFQPGVVHQPQIGGVIFDELERDGTMKKQLSILQNTITFSVGRYARWAEYWPIAERILSSVMKLVLRNMTVSSMFLNAVNRFFWDGDENGISYKLLVRNGCPYIASNVLNQGNLTHSFHGFVKDSEGDEDRRIDNINFSVAERVGEKNAADLTFNLRKVFQRKPLTSDNLFVNAERNFLERAYKEMHEANNRLFLEVIVKEVCDEIPGLQNS